MQDLNKADALRDLDYSALELRALAIHAEHIEALAEAWRKGYEAGVADEATSVENVGIAGLGGKIRPARQNPYTTPDKPTSTGRTAILTGARRSGMAALLSEALHKATQTDPQPSDRVAPLSEASLRGFETRLGTETSKVRREAQWKLETAGRGRT